MNRRWVAAQPTSRDRCGRSAWEQAGIEALFAGLNPVTIDAATGELAGQRLRRYRRSHALELGDALIGVSAQQHAERLATFNRRHYPGITQLVSPDR